MAENTINVKIKQRTDTESNWASKNPVLLDGEHGYVKGSGKYKIGDGTKKWSELSYYESLNTTDKTKLDGIAVGANKTIVDSALSSTSTNPVQNKIVNSALAGKSNNGHTHDDRYYTESEINSKLNGKANSSHTHNYAGSSSVGGAANSAVKLATARTVSNTEDFVMSFSYDGSANSNANLRYYNSCIYIGNTNNYPYHRFAKIDTQTDSYVDKSSTFLITQDYNDGGWGIIRISLRTNSSSVVSTVEAKWLVRCGLNVDCVQIGLYDVFGKTYADAFFKTSGAWAGTVIRNLASGARGSIARTWTLIDSTEADNTTTSDKKTSTESYASTSTAATTLHSQAYTSVVVATDGGTVSYANSAGNTSKVNNHTVNADVPSGAKFTDTNTWRPLGTTADTACAGNDSRLSNARPASDVSAWAKASSKPSYSKSEVGLGNVDNTADSAKSVKYATSAGSASSASKATGLVDYNATRQTIQIGYGGSGISGDAIKFIAGYTTGNGSDVNAKIKDVSKDALKSWLGLGSLAYSSATIPTIPSSLPANGGNSTTVNGHTVNSNVPANAKFTDTWRGVQNNLTSTATDQSLSAYQGKVLKDLVDKKTTFTYSSTQPTSPASNAVWIG